MEKQVSAGGGVPLPVKILGGPVLVFLMLFALREGLGIPLGDEPLITGAAVLIVVLVWLRVVWPAGFRRRG